MANIASATVPATTARVDNIATVIPIAFDSLGFSFINAPKLVVIFVNTSSILS